MISKKKADASQMFTYISTAIVIVVVLGFGIHWLMGLLDNVSEIECVQFKKDLEIRVRNNLDYGRVDTRPLRVDCDVREICFITDTLFEKKSHSYNDNGDVLDYLINSTYSGNVQQNVFMLNNIPVDFFYLEKLYVEPNNLPLCFNVTNIGLNVRFEGQGNHVILKREQ